LTPTELTTLSIYATLTNAAEEVEVGEEEEEEEKEKEQNTCSFSLVICT